MAENKWVTWVLTLLITGFWAHLVLGPRSLWTAGFGADGTTGRISSAAVEMGVANTPCIVGATQGTVLVLVGWLLVVVVCVLNGVTVFFLKWRDGGLKDYAKMFVIPFLKVKDVDYFCFNSKMLQMDWKHLRLFIRIMILAHIAHMTNPFTSFFARLNSARKFSSIWMVDMVVFWKVSPTVHSKLPALSLHRATVRLDMQIRWE